MSNRHLKRKKQAILAKALELERKTATALRERIRHLEARLVAADKALEEGVRLSDLSDGALRVEQMRRYIVAHPFARAEDKLNASELAQRIVADRQMAIEQDGPEFFQWATEHEVRAILDFPHATSAADSVAGSSSRASGGAPSVLDAGNGVAQTAQALADAINAAPQARAIALVNGSTVTLQPMPMQQGDVVTINGVDFQLSPPHPRRYRPPPRRLDGRRAK